MKKELIWQIIFGAAAVTLIIFYILQYNSQTASFSNALKNKLTEKSTPANSQNKNANSVILTSAEVAKHNSASDCWFIVNGKVYDVTAYASLHPGGAQNIDNYCGADATQAYSTKGGRGSHSSFADSQLANLYLGDLNKIIQNSPTKVKLNINNSQSNNKNREYEDD